MKTRTDDLEEARLLGGRVQLVWHGPRTMAVDIGSAQEFSELLDDLDEALSMVDTHREDFMTRARAIHARWSKG